MIQRGQAVDIVIVSLDVSPVCQKRRADALCGSLTWEISPLAVYPNYGNLASLHVSALPETIRGAGQLIIGIAVLWGLCLP